MCPIPTSEQGTALDNIAGTTHYKCIYFHYSSSIIEKEKKEREWEYSENMRQKRKTFFKWNIVLILMQFTYISILNFNK